MTTSNSDDEGDLNLFADPPDFYPPSPKPTIETHTMLCGAALAVQLVGHNPLWGHHLWNAGRIISNYLESNPSLVASKTVLELGAGAGVPSLICGVLGASTVVCTDYPDRDLIENLSYNITNCKPIVHGEQIDLAKIVIAEGYRWGDDPSSLKSHITNKEKSASHGQEEASDVCMFDVVILADLLFNHSEHEKLLSTVDQTLSKSTNASALVFFTPYRPWLLAKDLAFFDLAREAGFEVKKLLEEKMKAVMFENDPGDEEVRRTVFGYALSRHSST